MADNADALRKLVSEMRDAAETALDFWQTSPDVRAEQIVQALDAAAAIVELTGVLEPARDGAAP